MASSGKKRTTFAKLAREQKLRERRQDKQAKKDARRRAPELDPEPGQNGDAPVAIPELPGAMPPGADR